MIARVRRPSPPAGALLRVFGAWTRRGGCGVCGFFATGGRTVSGSHRAEELGDGGAVLDDGAGGQRLQERPAVAAGAQARVEDRDDAAVAVPADQPAEALAQLQDGRRQRVL